jgi:hypothetical protein
LQWDGPLQRTSVKCLKDSCFQKFTANWNRPEGLIRKVEEEEEEEEEEKGDSAN